MKLRRAAAFGILLVMAMLVMAGCGQKEQVQSTNPASNEAGQQQSAQQQEQQKPHDAKAIIEALKEAGLPIGEIEAYTAETDPNELLGRPGQYVSKANFVDTRIKEEVGENVEVENGGSVEVFANEEDAKRRFDYVSEIAKSGLFSEYDYLHGTVLLRLSHKLTPDQAKEYEQKLAEILK